jgi:hypothetical protein
VVLDVPQDCPKPLKTAKPSNHLKPFKPQNGSNLSKPVNCDVQQNFEEANEILHEGIFT